MDDNKSGCSKSKQDKVGIVLGIQEMVLFV